MVLLDSSVARVDVADDAMLGCGIPSSPQCRAQPRRSPW